MNILIIGLGAIAIFLLAIAAFKWFVNIFQV